MGHADSWHDEAYRLGKANRYTLHKLLRMLASLLNDPISPPAQSRHASPSHAGAKSPTKVESHVKAFAAVALSLLAQTKVAGLVLLSGIRSI